MTKIYLAILILLSLFQYSVFAQSQEQIAPSDLDSPIIDNEAQILELIAIFNDAIDAPTKYNSYVIPFINEPTFPIKQDLVKQDYDLQIREWILQHPLIIDKFLEVRKEEHEKLYGPRKQ